MTEGCWAEGTALWFARWKRRWHERDRFRACEKPWLGQCRAGKVAPMGHCGHGSIWDGWFSPRMVRPCVQYVWAELGAIVVPAHCYPPDAWVLRPYGSEF